MRLYLGAADTSVELADCFNKIIDALPEEAVKKLEIFDEPKELSDFYKATLYYSWRLQRPPQNWQYVYTKELEK